jgi:hypothetical protein
VLRLAQRLGQAPIDNERLAVSAEHHVARLEIAMQHASAMRVLDGVADVDQALNQFAKRDAVKVWRTAGVSLLVDGCQRDITRGLTPSVRLDCAALLVEKQRLIVEQQSQAAFDRHDPRRASRDENNQRRRRLRVISQRLATLASETRTAFAAELQTAQARLAANAVLQSREFSFCLFSAPGIRPFVQFTKPDK